MTAFRRVQKVSQVREDRVVSTARVSFPDGEVGEPSVPVYTPDFMQRYAQNPLRYFLEQFEWGRADSILYAAEGPLPWQREVLEAISASLERDDRMCRVAISSGKGCGKTALMAMLFLWHVSCFEHGLTTLTSVTGFQSTYRVWNEVERWYRAWKLRSLFDMQGMRLFNKSNKTQFGAHQTWSTDHPEAFHGAHAEHLAFLVDEATAVHAKILEAIETGLSGEHSFLVYASNPTRSQGRFYECFHGERKERWLSFTVDAREVALVHRDHIQDVLADCGGDIEASLFRINIRGLFALEDYDTVVPLWIIDESCKRQASADTSEPVIIGADIARKGDAKTVFVVRQGMHILEICIYAKLEIDLSADKLIALINRYTRLSGVQAIRPVIFVDADGVGSGVLDICTSLGYNVFAVHSATTATASQRYANRRAELWFLARDWLKTKGCLLPSNPLHQQLIEQLTAVTYKRDALDRILIESKEDMASRGLKSPDLADAFVYTFGQNGLNEAGAWGRELVAGRTVLGPTGMPLTAEQRTQFDRWGFGWAY